MSTRLVDANGCFAWSRTHFLSRTLTGRTVGLERICDDLVRVQYANKQIAMIDESDGSTILNPEWWAPTSELE
jgi:hypothetical protein